MTGESVRTYFATTTVPGRAAAEALGEAVERLDPAPVGIGTFEVEDGRGDWEVGAWFLGPPDATALAVLAAAFAARPFAVGRVEDEDWVAKVRRELHPVRAGRFVVHGGHDAARIPANAIGLRIEAAMAFGTGHHATTQGCLVLLDRLARRGLRARRCADIGCGTGVLAMAAARLWPARAVAGDIDRIAVATARENLRANGVAARVATVEAAGLRHPRLRAGAPYDLIFANILARPLVLLAPEIARHLSPGGVAVLSGLLDRQAAGVEAVYRGHGLHRVGRLSLAGWTSLALSDRPLRLG